MSEVKKLSEVIKAASAVTNLDSHSVMCRDASGNLHAILKVDLLNVINPTKKFTGLKNGWYRVMEVSNCVGIATLFCLNNAHAFRPWIIAIAANVSASTKSIEALITPDGDFPIRKIRLVYDPTTSKTYLEVCLFSSVNNPGDLQISFCYQYGVSFLDSAVAVNETVATGCLVNTLSWEDVKVH